MRIYETTFILSPQADDASFDRQIKSVTDLIGKNNGKILKEDRWGVRRLAYPIKKFTQGYYTRLIYEADNTVLQELERFFRLEEAYIRDLTVLFEGSLEEKPDRHHDRNDHHKKSEKPAEKPAEKAEERPADKPAEEPVEPKAEEAPAEAETPAVEEPKSDDEETEKAAE